MNTPAEQALPFLCALAFLWVEESPDILGTPGWICTFSVWDGQQQAPGHYLVAWSDFGARKWLIYSIYFQFSRLIYSISD
jgi:hypothetical protein